MFSPIAGIRQTPLFRLFSFIITFMLVTGLVLPPAQAAMLSDILPAPGQVLALSAPYRPALLRGITINPDNPLLFDFLLQRGDTVLKGAELKAESEKLVKYFLTALTVPDDEGWVNLSPYEKDQIIADSLSATQMGRTMLEQDYLLKQLTASLTYPETPLGQTFWTRVQDRAFKQFGTRDIPIDNFNKVWIVPERAVVTEEGATAFVVDWHLKVMMEADYQALKNDQAADGALTGAADDPQAAAGQELSARFVREIVVPELEKEVNAGTHFAPTRQVFLSVILATWFKQRLRESLLGKVYVDQNKTAGVDTEDPAMKEQIYAQYLAAFKQGVYNLVREDYDAGAQTVIPRKYFSGGMVTTLSSPLVIVPASQVASSAVKDPGKTGDLYTVDVAATETPGEAETLAAQSSPVAWQAREDLAGYKMGHGALAPGGRTLSPIEVTMQTPDGESVQGAMTTNDLFNVWSHLDGAAAKSVEGFNTEFLAVMEKLKNNEYADSDSSALSSSPVTDEITISGQSFFVLEALAAIEKMQAEARVVKVRPEAGNGRKGWDIISLYAETAEDDAQPPVIDAIIGYLANADSLGLESVLARPDFQRSPALHSGLRIPAAEEQSEGDRILGSYHPERLLDYVQEELADLQIEARRIVQNFLWKRAPYDALPEGYMLTTNGGRVLSHFLPDQLSVDLTVPARDGQPAMTIKGLMSPEKIMSLLRTARAISQEDFYSELSRAMANMDSITMTINGKTFTPPTALAALRKMQEDLGLTTGIQLGTDQRRTVLGLVRPYRPDGAWTAAETVVADVLLAHWAKELGLSVTQVTSDLATPVEGDSDRVQMVWGLGLKDGQETLDRIAARLRGRPELRLEQAQPQVEEKITALIDTLQPLSSPSVRSEDIPAAAVTAKLEAWSARARDGGAIPVEEIEALLNKDLVLSEGMTTSDALVQAKDWLGTAEGLLFLLPETDPARGSVQRLVHSFNGRVEGYEALAGGRAMRLIDEDWSSSSPVGEQPGFSDLSVPPEVSDGDIVWQELLEHINQPEERNWPTEIPEYILAMRTAVSMEKNFVGERIPQDRQPAALIVLLDQWQGRMDRLIDAVEESAATESISDGDVQALTDKIYKLKDWLQDNLAPATSSPISSPVLKVAKQLTTEERRVVRAEIDTLKAAVAEYVVGEWTEISPEWSALPMAFQPFGTAQESNSILVYEAFRDGLVAWAKMLSALRKGEKISSVSMDEYFKQVEDSARIDHALRPEGDPQLEVIKEWKDRMEQLTSEYRLYPKGYYAKVPFRIRAEAEQLRVKLDSLPSSSPVVSSPKLDKTFTREVKQTIVQHVGVIERILAKQIQGEVTDLPAEEWERLQTKVLDQAYDDIGGRTDTRAANRHWAAYNTIRNGQFEWVRLLNDVGDIRRLVYTIPRTIEARLQLMRDSLNMELALLDDLAQRQELLRMWQDRLTALFDRVQATLATAPKDSQQIALSRKKIEQHIAAFQNQLAEPTALASSPVTIDQQMFDEKVVPAILKASSRTSTAPLILLSGLRAALEGRRVPNAKQQVLGNELSKSLGMATERLDYDIVRTIVGFWIARAASLPMEEQEEFPVGNLLQEAKVAEQRFGGDREGRESPFAEGEPRLMGDQRTNVKSADFLFSLLAGVGRNRGGQTEEQAFNTLKEQPFYWAQLNAGRFLDFLRLRLGKTNAELRGTRQELLERFRATQTFPWVEDLLNYQTSQARQAEPAQQAAQPQSSPAVPGGIDFDPSNMDLQIRRDAHGVPLPLPMQDLEQIHINGLYPVILNIAPANLQGLPFLLGLLADQDPPLLAREVTVGG